MKRIVVPFLLVVMIAVMTSCDTKTCKCYINDGINPVDRVTEYVDEGTACSTLDYDRGNRYRICLENNEPDIDPSQIGQDYKSRGR